MLSEEGNVKRHQQDQQALRWAKQLETAQARVGLYDSLVDLLALNPPGRGVEFLEALVAEAKKVGGGAQEAVEEVLTETKACMGMGNEAVLASLCKSQKAARDELERFRAEHVVDGGEDGIVRHAPAEVGSRIVTSVPPQLKLPVRNEGFFREVAEERLRGGPKRAPNKTRYDLAPALLSASASASASADDFGDYHGVPCWLPSLDDSVGGSREATPEQEALFKTAATVLSLLERFRVFRHFSAGAVTLFHQQGAPSKFFNNVKYVFLNTAMLLAHLKQIDEDKRRYYTGGVLDHTKCLGDPYPYLYVYGLLRHKLAHLETVVHDSKFQYAHLALHAQGLNRLRRLFRALPMDLTEACESEDMRRMVGGAVFFDDQ